MFIDLFLRGTVIGFSIAAPVGPIGVLCIKRTLNDGRLTGFASGMGAACADALYGLLAVSGLSVVTGFMVDSRLWFHLIGGLFLVYLGVKTFLSRSKTNPVDATIDSGKAGIWQAFASTFVLTLSNPMTILSFLAIFAALNRDASCSEPALLVAGVFIGSAAWWLLLSGLVGALRSRLSAEMLSFTNVVSAVILIAFGAFAMITCNS